MESPTHTKNPSKPPSEAPQPKPLPTALRVALICLGTVLVAVGAVGLFLPALPGVPLLLLAAACYARSSNRLYTALLANRFLGPSIRQWRENRSIPRRAKVTAIIMIVVAFGLSIGLVLESLALRITLGVIGITLVAFLARLPSR